MAYAVQFDEMFRHTEVFKMAAFTFATSCLSMSRTDAVLNPVGLVFKLYGNHFGTVPVEVDGNSPQPAPRYPIGGDQPKVNAGSPTYPLDVSAALSSDGKTITVAVVNPTESAQQLGVTFKGVELAGGGTVWQIAPGNIDASIFVGQPPQVEIKESAVDAPNGSLAIAPISVSIYAFPVK
jgi:alpha-L-arabinofuranosidase